MLAQKRCASPRDIQCSPMAAVSNLPSPKLQPTTEGRKFKAVLENRGTLPDHVCR